MKTKNNHAFWGTIDENWAGFSPDKKYHIPDFKVDSPIFLDDEYNDDGDEKDFPTEQQLDEYAKTYEHFIQSFEEVILDIKEQAYHHYWKYYKRHYEAQKTPLLIDNQDTHFDYMKDLIYIRISDNETIRLCIRYDLDQEHGLEIKIQSNKVIQFGGIAET